MSGKQYGNYCHVEEERFSNAMVKWKNVFMGHIIIKSREEKY